MGATTSLAGKELSVAAGATVSSTVQIRNSGTLVDQFTVDVVGDAVGWAKVEPDVINLMPGTEGQVTVTFAPPRDSTVHAGVVPFGIRVLSREDPGRSMVEEGAVQVEPFTDLQVELVPKTSKCRRMARHELVVDNAGNYPIAVELTATDPEDELQLAIDHPSLTIEPGTSAFLRLRARPYDKFLRGQERRHPFQVTAMMGEAAPVSANGTVVQQQLLPKWLLPALLALLALAILAVTLWFTVLKPTLQSAARDTAEQVVKEEQQKLTDKADAAEKKAAKAEERAAEAEKKVGEGGAVAAANLPGPVTGPGGIDLARGQAFDFRITTDAPATANLSDFDSFTADPLPDGKTLVVTDLVLQNPRGDSGTLRILRGDQILLEFGLNNFRDVDYHYLEPLTFAPGQQLKVAVNCSLPGAPEPATGRCRPSVSFSGRIAG
ncbi:COG1470 family protein [Actinokineospora sp. HUAS TT18]|uniref:COG1470 family protein n=1 Tax=Actinokineospora sp. HUAS TT18 TaxID=3447451 RepID=UPI003F525355